MKSIVEKKKSEIKNTIEQDTEQDMGPDIKATGNVIEDLNTEVRGTIKECAAYRKIAEEKGFNADQTIKESNLEDIPYVSWAHFKNSNQQFHHYLRIPMEKLDHWTLSSSTTGDPSVVGRNEDDVKVFLWNYNKVFEDYGNKKNVKKLTLFGPNPTFLKHLPFTAFEKRGLLFFSDITLMWKGYDIDYLLQFKMAKSLFYMVGHLFLRKKAFIEINGKDMEKSFQQVEKERLTGLVANSVPLIYTNCTDYYEKKGHGFNMPEDFHVQTGGGGWSGTKGQVKLQHPIKKTDFYEKIGKFFNIPITNFGDCYGATETPLSVGGHWSKKYNDIVFHLPKEQGRIVLRDFDTLEPIKTVNTPGAIEMITPYGVSAYAGVAVLLDDVAEIVDFNRCEECGREGTIFRITGRLTPDIGKGCTSFYNLTPYKGPI